MKKIFIVISIIWSSFVLISIIDHPNLIAWGIHSIPTKDSLFLAFLPIILFNIAGWIRKIFNKNR
jgi:hypothetical protein